MKLYARVKETLRFGRECEWKEVKRESRMCGRNRLYFVDGTNDNAYVYDIIQVF